MKRIAMTGLAMSFLLMPPLLRADHLADLRKYEYGGDRTCVLAVERQVEDSMNDPARQRSMASKLLDVMTDPAATLAAKQHAGIMLRICGTEAEVPVLAAMLGDDRVGDFARGALERIPAVAAGEALRESLGKLQGPALIGVIHSTANRHDREAVGTLVGLTTSGDAASAAAAAHALGRIGGPEAVACLKRLAADGKDPQNAHAYLSCGIIAMEGGERKDAAEIFGDLTSQKYPAAIRRGALNGQLMLSDAPGTLLAAWLDGDDAEARQVASDHLQDQPAAWLLDIMKGRPLAQAVPVAEVLASRSDKGALPVLTEAAQQEQDRGLRTRAIMAMARVGDQDSVPLLIDALDDTENVSLAAMTALCVMPSTLVDGPVIEGLQKHDGPMRAELIDLVVARRMTAAIPLLLQFAKGEGDAAADDDVYSALDVLGDEETLSKLVAIILGTGDGTHRDKIRRTYLQIARRYDNTVKPIFAAMSDDAAAVALLPVLGWVGGKAAEARVEEALASSKIDLRAAGVGALSHWPDASVAGKLVEVVKEEKDQGVRVEALRAYIRMASVFDDDRPDKDTLQMLQWAFGAAERPEEENLVIRRAGAVRAMETLRWLTTLLDTEAVAKEACRSIVELARDRDLSNPNRDEFVKALRRVIEVSKDASTVNHAKAFIEDAN